MNRVHHKHLARRRQSPCRADAAAMLYMLLGLVLAAAGGLGPHPAWPRLTRSPCPTRPRYRREADLVKAVAVSPPVGPPGTCARDRAGKEGPWPCPGGRWPAGIRQATRPPRPRRP